MTVNPYFDSSSDSPSDRSFDRLSIRWHVDPLSAQGGQPLSLATPQVHVNGRALFVGERPVVDTLSLLVCSGQTGGFDLLTCTCGVPGCAGFHEEVEVLADAHSVRWHIPAQGYSGALHESFGAGPWTFEFERQSFEQAITQAEILVLEAEKNAGAPLALCPWEPWADDDTEKVPPVADVLRKSRARFEHTLRQQRCFEQAFGDMAKKDLLVQTAERSFSLTVRQYAWAVESRADLPCVVSTQEDFSALERTLNQAAQALRKDPRAAVLGLPDDLLDCYVRALGPEHGVTDSAGELFWRRSDCTVALREACASSGR